MKPINLLYHDIIENDNESGFTGASADRYKLSCSNFIEHINQIRELKNQECIDISRLNQPTSSKMAFILTLDDGGASATKIADLIEKEGWRGHFFITTDYIAKRGFVDQTALRDLYARGHVIGSHSGSHPPRMSACEDHEIAKEWQSSVNKLENILGAQVVSASIPGGYYSKKVAQLAAKAGIKYLFTSEPIRSIKTIDGCNILGRFTIQRHHSADFPAAILSNGPIARWKQYLFWNSKKMLKMAGGRHYNKYRELLLR